MDGNNLLNQVVSLSGLPEDQLEPWFKAQIESRGLNPYQLDLEQLREVMVDMLQDLILQTENEDQSV